LRSSSGWLWLEFIDVCPSIVPKQRIYRSSRLCNKCAAEMVKRGCCELTQ
jgi:hypothetical protein